MTRTPTPTHAPVLLPELLQHAGPVTRVVDGTLGHGGHAEAFLEGGATLLGIDRDPDALAIARARLARFGSRAHCREGRFFDDEVLDEVAAFQPDLILLDLGVSSAQLDHDARGFTFRPGAALDMRMEGRGAGLTAATLLNTWPVERLREVFRDYGDDPKAGRLAAEIVRRRARAPLTTSDDLVNAIRAVLGPGSGAPDFARLFQAVRIAVNDELPGLARALPRLRDALVPSGLLAVISYHSGEDRLVKQAMREWSRSCICPPSFPVCRCRGRALGAAVPRRPIAPGEAEVARNPRARSAHLRLFRKADAA